MRDQGLQKMKLRQLTVATQHTSSCVALSSPASPVRPEQPRNPGDMLETAAVCSLPPSPSQTCAGLDAAKLPCQLRAEPWQVWSRGCRFFSLLLDFLTPDRLRQQHHHPLPQTEYNLNTCLTSWLLSSKPEPTVWFTGPEYFLKFPTMLSRTFQNCFKNKKHRLNKKTDQTRIQMPPSDEKYLMLLVISCHHTPVPLWVLLCHKISPTSTYY